jgi:hypothetical protein
MMSELYLVSTWVTEKYGVQVEGQKMTLIYDELHCMDDNRFSLLWWIPID